MPTCHDDALLRHTCLRGALPADLQGRFVELEPSEAARRFISACQQQPHSRVSGWVFGRLRTLLSDYDAYGLLDLYPMHLLARAQWAQLLSAAPGRQRLLDVGAGAGHVTAELAPLFHDVVTTETSRVMAWRLRQRGLVCHQVDLASQTTSTAPPEMGRFDVISCLNVLDRCAYPHTLLARLRSLIADAGRLALSVPLPLAPHVHVGPETVDPEEPLPNGAATWEASLGPLVEQVLVPNGWNVERLARAPYLCRGDRHMPVRALDAAILICAPVI